MWSFFKYNFLSGLWIVECGNLFKEGKRVYEEKNMHLIGKINACINGQVNKSIKRQYVDAISITASKKS